MSRLLTPSFYNSEDVVSIAKGLLNKVICTRINGEFTSGKIVETEAYRGPDDKACHAFNYRRSPKNEAMYGPPGTAYVYTCYGIYDLFNVVTADIDVPHAVLIRAVEPLDGIQIMMARRKIQKKINLTNGPGKLAIALGINKKLSGQNLIQDQDIWIEDYGISEPGSNIISGPRVGLTTAEECSNWPWRFCLKTSAFCSKPSKVFYKFQ
jgi:DNA-3-methyladenine glycosylase